MSPSPSSFVAVGRHVEWRQSVSFALVWRPNTSSACPLSAPSPSVSRLHLQRRRVPCRISTFHRTRTTQTTTATRRTRRISSARRTTRRPRSRSIHFRTIHHAHLARLTCPTLLSLAHTYTGPRYTTAQSAVIAEITKVSREGARRPSFEKFTARSDRRLSNSRRRT